MIIVLSFSLLCHKPQLCSYGIHIMTNLHLANDSWNLNILKFYFEFLKIWNTIFLIMNVFHMWMVGYHHFNFFLISILFIKRVLSLMFYKFWFWGVKVQKSFTKAKTQFIELIFWKFFHIHINHLAQISLINMTLKWHCINIFEKINNFSIVQHGFWFVWLWLHPIAQTTIRHSPS